MSYNPRNAQNVGDRRQDRGRKPYTPQYNTPLFKSPSEKSNGKPRRAPAPKNSDRELAGAFGEHLPEIRKLLEAVIEEQKQRTAATDRHAEAMERIAEALGRLAEGVADWSAAAIRQPVPVVPESNARPVERGKVLQVISDMRNNGATYTEIARHLDSENVATFSGKGRWHAQTIHRLCQTECPPPQAEQ